MLKVTKPKPNYWNWLRVVPFLISAGLSIAKKWGGVETIFGYELTWWVAWYPYLGFLAVTLFIYVMGKISR